MRELRPYVLVLVVALAIPAIVLAQSRPFPLGTSPVANESPAAKNPRYVDPRADATASSLIFRRAVYGTGGVALRNRQIGVINISGVSHPLRAAFVYWAYLFAGGVTPPPTQGLALKRLTPAPVATKTVVGALLVIGADPCWGSGGIAVYRGQMPLTNGDGSGSYQVTLTSQQSALNTGEDPWAGNPVFPAAEGASLVMIGPGASTVQLYDTQIPAGTTFHTSYSYALTLPAAATGTSTLWDSIGADGQLGVSRAATQGAGKTTRINGVIVAGPGGLDPDGDLDGSSGWPLPQLWDDTGHDITTVTPSGTTALKVTIAARPHVSHPDCVTTIANVVAVQ
jgi:hypothetical protein